MVPMPYFTDWSMLFNRWTDGFGGPGHSLGAGVKEA